ncbi:hypothetical protein SAMN05216388_1017112 [Halorientalis persicus]|uniref:Uncharacterized protein n=1 Tax=Halorientalis persicus TaxID=1367881 RepID=A0A1H8S1A5_9EURY|nr:hypothetical protein [Halorientalis persicus]SEO72440.1 hypothetical protein SAMN05216388_1017112 [Halorientalis persicus]
MPDQLHDRSDARLETRRNRERRKDATVELPFNERVTVECPGCGETFELTIATGDPAQTTPSWGGCTTWDCDAFLKFEWDGTHQDPERETEETESAQTGLDQFAGGASA